ncbi:peptidase, partial [Mariniblastus sp.]|nr:peptidase [Mariniblastus sp.]
EPSIIVTDRSHNTLQYLTMDGEYIETLTGYGLPANVDIYKNIMMIPELKARITLLDENNKIVGRLGEAVERVNSVKELRRKPELWIDGQFVHPHDACFDSEGNIFVAEWVETGRITKLTRI